MKNKSIFSISIFLVVLSISFSSCYVGYYHPGYRYGGSRMYAPRHYNSGGRYHIGGGTYHGGARNHNGHRGGRYGRARY